MSKVINPKTYFYEQAGLNKKIALDVLKQTLHNKDDGELFLEHKLRESISWERGKFQASDYSITEGFGLRGVFGEEVDFAYSNDFSEESLRRAGEAVRAFKSGYVANPSFSPKHHSDALYTDKNPLVGADFETKVRLFDDTDRYIRAQSPLIEDVRVFLRGEWQLVNILRADGFFAYDVRPLVKLSITVTLREGEKTGEGSKRIGGRYLYDRLLDPGTWQYAADEALRLANLKLEASPSPAGKMPIVLGKGPTADFIHEAIGHGLEADFIRKKSSYYTNKLGKQVAAKGVTIIDGGTYPEDQGSIAIDDWGTPAQKTVLVEDGKLVNFIQDRQNARLLGMNPTGNARRGSFQSPPIPRMTPTVMLEGSHTTEEMIHSIREACTSLHYQVGKLTQPLVTLFLRQVKPTW